MSEKRSYPINHDVKILPEFYMLVNSGVKTSEVRLFDRDYQVGDYLKLHEYDGVAYTGKVITCIITHVLSDEEYVKEGYCVLSFQIVSSINKTVSVTVWGNMFQLYLKLHRELDARQEGV